MPKQRRFRRLGTASATVSAGALALVVWGAAPAHADQVPCPVGTDPASTIENWKCQLGNLRDQLTPTTPAPTPTKTATKPRTTTKPEATTGTRRPAARPAPAPTPPPAAAGGGATVQSNGLRPAGEVGTPPDVSVFLPSPQVAADPGGRRALPQTRLISPTAAGERTEQAPLLATAVAAGLAGVVGALNISVLGRRRRGRA